MPDPDPASSVIAAFPGAQRTHAPLTCGSCVCWQEMKQDDPRAPAAGLCLRFPPQMINLGPILEPLTGKPRRGPDGQLVLNLQQLRPVMPPTETCHEWQPRMRRAK